MDDLINISTGAVAAATRGLLDVALLQSNEDINRSATYRWLDELTDHSPTATAATAAAAAGTSTSSFDAGRQGAMSPFTAIDRYVTPVWYVVGIPGNILAYIVWIQSRMRPSSGCYLAALALDECIFLLLQVCALSAFAV